MPGECCATTGVIGEILLAEPLRPINSLGDTYKPFAIERLLVTIFEDYWNQT